MDYGKYLEEVDSVEAAYNEGYSSGYDDEEPECPYLEDSPEAVSWWSGYKDGTREH